METYAEFAQTSCATLTTSNQVVLEGVKYDTFKVPECPECLIENRTNSIVRSYVPGYPCFLTSPSAQTRIDLFRRIDTARSTGSIVSLEILTYSSA